MQIFVDADACPVVPQVEKVANEFKIPVTLLCDTNHVLRSETSTVITVGAGKDAVDLALINRIAPGDLVVTQDYGVAALALGKRAAAIHQSGMIYTDANIDGLLAERAMAQRARRSGKKHHMKGPRKRTAADNAKFEASFRSLVREMIKKNQKSPKNC
jgi:uncharacterized protein YaiI (UPF0178 family)